MCFGGLDATDIIIPAPIPQTDMKAVGMYWEERLDPSHLHKGNQ